MTEWRNDRITEFRNYGISDKSKTIWHRQLRCRAIKKVINITDICRVKMWLTPTNCINHTLVGDGVKTLILITINVSLFHSFIFSSIYFPFLYTTTYCRGLRWTLLLFKHISPLTFFLTWNLLFVINFVCVN